MSLRHKAISGSIWTFIEQFSVKGINFLVQIFLARILAPAQFALIAMMTIVIAIGSAIVEGGLTQSLIRTRSTNYRDYSTIFFANIFTSLIVYGICYMIAPTIANFYEQPPLLEMVRVFTLIIPINAFMAVQQTLFTKAMNFKRQALIQAPSILIAGIIAIYLAHKGLGAWALVYMQIIQAVLMSLQYWYFSDWRPVLIFDFKKFKLHFNFGYKLMLNSFLLVFFGEIYNIIIGKFYSATTLGLYNRAYAFQHLPGFIFTRALNKVTYPLFSEIQDDNKKLKYVYKSITLQAMIIFTPIMAFFYFMAKPFILAILGDQWINAEFFLKILSIGGITVPIQAYNWNIIQVKGKSDLVLKINAISKFITIIALFFVVPYGINVLLYLQVIISYLTFFLFAYYSGNIIKYPIMKQIFDLLPIIAITYFSGYISHSITELLTIKNWNSMMIYAALFGIIYFSSLYIINFIPFRNLLSNLQKFNKKL